MARRPGQFVAAYAGERPTGVASAPICKLKKAGLGDEVIDAMLSAKLTKYR